MEKYSYPILEKIRSFLFITLTVVFVYLVKDNQHTGKMLWDLIWIGFAFFGIIDLIRSFMHITLTESSLVIKYPLMTEKLIYFSEVISISDMNDPPKIILRNKAGNKILTIKKSLKNFEEFYKELQLRKARRLRIHINNRFKIGNYVIISLISGLIIFLGAIVFSLIRKEYLFALFGLIVTSYYLYTFRNLILFIQLTVDSINLRYPYKLRCITFKEVKNIYYDTNANHNNILTAYTIIEINDGEKISLSKFKPNDELLYESCKYYFENQKRST